MRTLTLTAVLTLALLGTAAPAFAEDDPGVTRAERVQEELRRRREAARDDARVYRRREAARDDGYYDDGRRRDEYRGHDTQVWVGLGTGLTRDWIEIPCGSPGAGAECSEPGRVFNTYSASFTVATADGVALRLRGVRANDSGYDAHAPYETAAMIGARLGRSDWYGLLGAGVLHNVDDDFTQGDEVTGLAWEVMYAPRTHGPLGLELGIQGNAGEYADFVAFNIGLRFGALR